MNDNTNKIKAVNAIWENPARAFNCEFKQSGNYWINLRGGEYDETGKIRITKTANGENIRVYYNGGSRDEKTDVFTYLNDYVFNGAGFYDTLQRLASIYGFTLEQSAEERQKIEREALAREVAASLIESLRLNPTGETAKYLTDVRGLKPDGGHFGELTADSLRRAKETLTNKGYKYKADDLTALKLTESYAAQGYNLVLPYYRDGRIVGLKVRNTRKGFTGDKYLNAAGLETGGYCDRLTTGEPVVIVEGELDAIRLTQAGIKNVVAMGGASTTDKLAKLLKARNISQVTYIPDCEYTPQRVKITDTLSKSIKALQNAIVDGEPVVTALYVAELPAPDDLFTNDKYKIYKDGTLKKYKTDADTYGKDGGDLCGLVEFAAPWYDTEINNLIEWAVTKEAENGGVNVNDFRNRFDAIYKRCATPYEREALKRDIKGKEHLAQFGVTPKALEDVDEWNRNKEYNNAIKAATEELQQAVENGANPVKINGAVAKLAEAQGRNTRDEWDKQICQTFEDELKAIKDQPDTLKTKWELGNITKTGTWAKYCNIEFWPADIAVFCAATSHGKTAILFQSALDLLAQYPDKTFLYVSCEENKRQLLERALNVYTDIQTTKDGKTVEAPNVKAGEYCFISQTRKKTIKAVIRGDVPPYEYDPVMNVSEHYNAVAAQVRDWVNRYGREIRPRLILINTEGTAESIAANVLHYVREYRDQGVEVGGVFVDYMQLLTSENKSYSRHDELKDVCKALRRCAASTEIPVIIAAQLNRDAIAGGIDNVTVANIGEAADIERIAHDIYFVWQTDKTKKDLYTKYDYPTVNGKKDTTAEPAEYWDPTKAGERANRIFYKPSDLEPRKRELIAGYLYIEQMKARDGKTGGWGLFPFDGERGRIDEHDATVMRGEKPKLIIKTKR